MSKVMLTVMFDNTVITSISVYGDDFEDATERAKAKFCIYYWYCENSPEDAPTPEVARKFSYQISGDYGNINKRPDSREKPGGKNILKVDCVHKEAAMKCDRCGKPFNAEEQDAGWTPLPDGKWACGCCCTWGDRNPTCSRCGRDITCWDADLVTVVQGKPVCEGCQCDEDFRPDNQAG
jgi:hypothetical protein